MDRNIGRVYELMGIVKIMERMLEEIKINPVRTGLIKFQRMQLGEDIDNPVEIGRIERCYNPCISCACHVTGDIEPITIRVI